MMNGRAFMIISLLDTHCLSHHFPLLLFQLSSPSQSLLAEVLRYPVLFSLLDKPINGR